MASRNLHQQQHPIAAPRGGGGTKQPASRRALGDIGNLVRDKINPRPIADSKPPAPAPPQQITRPVTRSFGAQLVRNGQIVVGPAAGAAAKRDVKQGAARPTKQKAPPQSKPVAEAIEISSPERKEGSTCSKKKVHTLTSVLIARSQSACGISEKPVDPVHDIDAADKGDELAVADYVEDIYKFYKISESSRRPGDYMESQIEINAKMRAILADWLIEVHHRFELMPETLFLAFNIIDRYLSLETVMRRELQLVGVAATLIACKYEEIWAPEVNDFICISDKAYTRDQILAKEKGILDKLEWILTVPTPYVFLVRFLKAAMSDQELEHMVFFLAELGLMQYSMISYTPSMFAASAIYAARCTLDRSPLWNETLKRHSGFSEQQLRDCAKLLVGFHSSATESKLKVVHRKYSSPRLSAVALHRPATQLLEEGEEASTSST